MCMFSMYSLFVTADVVYVFVCGDLYWDPRMGGALLPKTNQIQNQNIKKTSLGKNKNLKTIILTLPLLSYSAFTQN